MQIASSVLTLELSAHGGELRSIRTADGAEWLWHGDPEWWDGRSPLLFPVVGKSPNDQVTIAGKTYPMPGHGVARISDFEVAEAAPDRVTFVLRATEATRESFPFEFELAITYAVVGNRIEVRATIGNRDTRPMPMQFGFHPGFSWPLPGNEGKTHLVELGSGAEPLLSRLNEEKRLTRDLQASPFSKGRLVPDASQFRDAMVFLRDAGTKVSFFAEGGSRIDMETENLPNLALWQKPGAPYLCLEPWQGTAPFPDQGNALENRNDAIVVEPGQSVSFRMDITVTQA